MPNSKVAIRLRVVTSQIENVPVSESQIRESAKLLACLSPEKVAQIPVTLAKQDGNNLTATIDYNTLGISSKALPTGTAGLHENMPIAWDDLDSDFEDITVLRNPANADLDICAIHGLEGNAFDTWVSKEGTMWLRDLLPQAKPFDRCRIMTFGYSLGLRDRNKTHDRVVDYADRLIREVLSLRDTPESQTRPLIFICHSMGGLVARIAMARLYIRPQEFNGLTTKLCGLLFLSTPHFGSRVADWNDFWSRLGKFAGVRENIVQELQTLNLSIVEVMELWKEMITKPLIRCLCEAEETKISVFSRLIVDQSAAGFLEESAEKVLGTDHHTICKYKNSQAYAYKRVLDNLKKLRDKLQRRIAEDEILQLPAEHVLDDLE